MASQLPVADAWPIDNRLKAVSSTPASFHVYVHVPFCVVRCGYCDFNTYTANEIGDVSQAKFHDHLIKEIDFSAKVLRDSGLTQKPVSTVFFGGGTPSLFIPKQISAILNSLEDRFGFTDDCEITLEANPEGLSKDSIAGYKSAGVNRMSLGVQSFDFDVLRVLDRVHTSEKVIAASAWARELGLRLSVDLIYGAPGESIESWENTLRTALDLQPDFALTQLRQRGIDDPRLAQVMALELDGLAHCFLSQRKWAPHCGAPIQATVTGSVKVTPASA